MKAVSESGDWKEEATHPIFFRVGFVGITIGFDLVLGFAALSSPLERVGRCGLQFSSAYIDVEVETKTDRIAFLLDSFLGVKKILIIATRVIQSERSLVTLFKIASIPSEATEMPSTNKELSRPITPLKLLLHRRR